MPEGLDDEDRGGVGIEQNVDDVIGIKTPDTAKNGLGPIVVAPGLELEFEVPQLTVRIARQRAGDFPDVFFGVVAFAEDEQLEQFAGEVLVGLFFAIVVVVEVVEHRRVADHGLQQVTEVTVSLLTQHHVLVVERVYLFIQAAVSGHEVVGPDQQQPFASRRGGGQHLPDPPAAELAHFLIALDAESLPVLFLVVVQDPVVNVGVAREAGRGFVERGRDIQLPDHGVDGLRPGQAEQGFNLIRVRADARAFQQVAGVAGGHCCAEILRGRHRRQRPKDQRNRGRLYEKPEPFHGPVDHFRPKH